MNWAFPSGGFSFGNLTPLQQSLYENNPNLAYRQLQNWWGNGNAGFDNTVFGRFLSSQQDRLYGQFLGQQSANPTGGLTWTKFLEQNAPGIGEGFAALPGSMRGVNPGQFRIRRELW